MESQIKYEFIKSTPKTKLHQGDLLKDVSIVLPTDLNTETNKYIISEITLPYGVIINQECDLEHDYNDRITNSKNQDKLLPNALILPAYLSEKFKIGEHLSENIKCNSWVSDQFKLIRKNQNSRFHFITENNNFQIPNLVIDFKHVYAININIIYKNLPKIYLASIGELYREFLSHRYTNYLV